MNLILIKLFIIKIGFCIVGWGASGDAGSGIDDGGGGCSGVGSSDGKCGGEVAAESNRGGSGAGSGVTDSEGAGGGGTCCEFLDSGVIEVMAMGVLAQMLDLIIIVKMLVWRWWWERYCLW